MRINDHTYNRISKATNGLEELGSNFVVFVGKTSESLSEYNYDVFNKFANTQRELVIDAFSKLSETFKDNDGLRSKLEEIPKMMGVQDERLKGYLDDFETVLEKLKVRAEGIRVINTDTSNPIIPDESDQIYENLYLEFKSPRAGFYKFNHKEFMLNKYSDEGDLIGDLVTDFQTTIVASMESLVKDMEKAFSDFGDKVNEAHSKFKGNAAKRFKLDPSKMLSMAQGREPNRGSEIASTSDPTNIVRFKLDIRYLGVKTKGVMPKEYVDAITARHTGADSEAKRVFDKYSKKLMVRNCAYEGGAHYNPRTERRGVFFNAEKDNINPRGIGKTFFHECGHMIDHAACDYGGFVSDSSEFKEALIKDGKAIVSVYEGLTDEAKTIFVSSLKTDYFASISDLIYPLSGKKIRGKWGHDNQYWETGSNIQKEAFAHFFEASMGDISKKDMLKMVFPESMACFDKMLRAM